MRQTRPLFFIGVHHPSHASAFARCTVSVNVLERRRGDFFPQQWLLDSGAFSRLTTGKGHLPLTTYAVMIRRWALCGTLLAAVAQDWMCEPVVLQQTGLTVAEHQHRTLDNYRELRERVEVPVMPVLQGYAPDDYRRHLEAYGGLLAPGQWVGVGSVCRRNTALGPLEAVMEAIHQERPDLRLHGFGLKRTALAEDAIAARLYSCDSLAWSYAARREGRNANSVAEALRYSRALETQPVQLRLW